jgi:BirA family biotin operon repressor/biotin-[acetyl-CoA-carboxylase] ligase
MPYGQRGHPQLDVAAIRAAVRCGAIGSDLRYLPSIDSTNRLARDLRDGSWRHGTVILADYQRAGRGRRDRSWMAPPGSSLLLSILLRATPDVRLTDAVAVAALAACDAIRDVTGLQAPVKWPNDILVDGRKVCGILAELATRPGAAKLIVGLGMNVNFDPSDVPDLPPATTSLQQASGRTVSREELAAALFNGFDLWYGYLTREPETVFGAWASRLDTIGRPVLVSDIRGTWQGMATGVQRDGALLVRDSEGTTHGIYAADISVRQLEGFTGS